MQKKGIVIFVVILVLAVVAVVVADLLKTQTDKRPDNPYALEYDDMKVVDPDLVTYKETKNFRLSGDSLGSLLIDSSSIYVTVDNELLELSFDGVLKNRINLFDFVRAFAWYGNERLVVSYYNSLAMFDKGGKKLLEKEAENDKSVITNISVYGNKIMVADAGNRKVYQLNDKLETLLSIEGKREEGAKHGFIIPSANFDLAFTSEGELWVANPGLHAVENYDDAGRLRSYWEASSFKVDGFSGCCNPARFTISNDGRFITSEKGIVRIKIHAPSGEFLSVVAPPQKFKNDGRAPDVAVDANNIVYALDYDKKMIRIFEPISE